MEMYGGTFENSLEVANVLQMDWKLMRRLENEWNILWKSIGNRLPIGAKNLEHNCKI
jgi:hypothetical protein